MKYKKFIIKGYRGISDVTEINISKESLIPIIGKNESGKTTCLEAINAFDFANDGDNEGKHLNNVENLYSTVETDIIIAAEVEVSHEFDMLAQFKEKFDLTEKEFLEIYPKGDFNILELDLETDKYSNIEFIKAYLLLKSTIEKTKTILIERNLKQKQYTIPLLSNLVPNDFLHTLSEEIVKTLPYILYFDDFRDRIDERVYIISDETNPLFSKWIEYIDELFKRTKREYSVYSLLDKSDSLRRSIVTEVQKYLNRVLAEEWSKYQFERQESIQIKMEYFDGGDIPCLRFKIVEKVFIDGNLEERYFDISDRSKGFYWYFNFIVKLHFNPKKRETEDIDTIYLLDEPGSYLHTYALDKLAEQLQRLSLKNKVIYCTHFHNLLNPEFIPINNIRIAEKIDQGKIILKRIDYDNGLIRPSRNSAYQPILDALEVRPPLLEYGLDNVVLVEGIYDYYSFQMFTSKFFSYFPCVSASSIVNQIPYMIFLKKKYLALWDNDGEGRTRLEKARILFGEIEGEKFLVLSSIGSAENTKLEEYYDKDELDNFNTNCLQLPSISFYKTILALFYSKDRLQMIEKYFPKTKSNFDKMEKILAEKIGKQIFV